MLDIPLDTSRLRKLACKTQTSVNLHLGTASQNTPVRKTSKFDQTLQFTDSPWRLFITMPTKLLLHLRERATLLLSINT